MTLVNAGVHFAGGAVLHWSGSEDRPAALFSGDIIQVVMDRHWVSFTYSYPNLVPERRPVVRRAIQLLEPYPFERIYGAWWVPYPSPTVPLPYAGRRTGTCTTPATRRSRVLLLEE
jgi:hypothetical protein